MAGNPNIAEYGKATQYRSGCEAAKNNGAKGGTESGKSRSITADMRKRLEKIVKMTLREGRADKINNISEAKGANLTVSDALLIKLVTMAMSGNMKALDRLLELLGMDEPEPQEAPQGQSSGFVNALCNTAAEVWDNEAPEKE